VVAEEDQELIRLSAEMKSAPTVVLVAVAEV
jgi:hypothetical protein